MRGPPPPSGGDSALLGWLILAGLVWLALQFRPHRRAVWKFRWEAYWYPTCIVLYTMGEILWKGFVAGPVSRAWRREADRKTVREARRSLSDKSLWDWLGHGGGTGDDT